MSITEVFIILGVTSLPRIELYQIIMNYHPLAHTEIFEGRDFSVITFVDFIYNTTLQLTPTTKILILSVFCKMIHTPLKTMMSGYETH